MSTSSDDDNHLVDDDMCFPRASVDPRLLKLQSDVTEFVTGIIINHETKFYDLIDKNFPDCTTKNNILGTTCKEIIEMITLSTNTLFNNIYLNIQNKTLDTVSNLVIEMAAYGNYGPHILLDKLVRLTINIHHEIIREELCVNTLDLYLKTVLKQVNVCLLSTNLLHILSKGPDDDTEFCVVPDGQKPFDITADIIYK